jgi:YD repeat-containing protein
LATQKTIYKEHANHLSLPERIQTSKGANPLEDRVIFEEYDAKGNPTVMLLKDGTKAKYFYNALNQVVLKVENYTSALNIPDMPNLSDACGFINLYPSAMMSVYNYDPITNQIVSIVASNCQTTTYVYDELHQLKLIKDNDGNILQEFDHNYKH